MVFHTAPPQPASNARWTCMPELLGGADASQNGLGERIPAKLMLRSAMRHQPFVNRARCELAVLHCHYCRSRTGSADAIATSVNSRQTCFKAVVDLNKSFFRFEIQECNKRR